MPEQVGPSRASTAGCGLRVLHALVWIASVYRNGPTDRIRETCPGRVLHVEPVHLHDGQFRDWNRTGFNGTAWVARRKRRAVSLAPDAATNDRAATMACGHGADRQGPRSPLRYGAADGLPARTAGLGATPRRRCPGCAHPDPPRCTHWASKEGGRSRQWPPAPARHGRPGDCGTNATTPATCRICGVSPPSAVLVHIDPHVSRTPLDRQRPPLMGDQIPSSEKRLERHTVKRSIIASEGAVGSAARSSASRVRQSRRRP